MTTDIDVPLPSEDHIELLLDEALLETFPASDPPAPAVNTAAVNPIVPTGPTNDPARRPDR